MKHKIVFFDMDGTIYQTEEDIILDSTLEAIQMLRDRGYIVCAATGRPLNQLELILKKVQFDYYVLINGSYILDKDFELIGEYPIDKEEVKEIVEICKEHNFGLMFHFGDASYIYNNFYPMYYFCKYCNVLDSLFYDETQTFHKRHRAYDAVILMDEGEDTIVKEFVENHEDLRWDLINVSDGKGVSYDIFNAMNDKSNGIEKILEIEGLTWKDAVCFGDSTNDIHMLEKADIGVAMGSASDHVKQYANWVTDSTQEHGIYHGVMRVLKEDEKESM